MKVETLQYTAEKGWSPNFPDLDSESTLIFVFCAPKFLHDLSPIQTLTQHYPKSKMIGCSTAGEIFASSVYDGSISVAIAKFEKTQIKLVVKALDDIKNSFEVGKEIINNLYRDDLSGIFILSEGMNVNGSELTMGVCSIIGNNTPVTGGLAGDDNNFKKTFVIENGVVYLNKIVAVGFYGKYLRFDYGYKGGWDIFGMERRITRSEGNVLYELDGKPALDVYKKYVGKEISDSPADAVLFPLTIRKNSSDTKHLVRGILRVDEKLGAVIFAGDIPQGYLAQLMHGNFDRLVLGAKEAGEQVLAMNKASKDKAESALLIAVSCVARKLVLGMRTNEETNALLEIFPKNTKMVGFYSYGEISPCEAGTCEFHNQTMTLTSISEEA